MIEQVYKVTYNESCVYCKTMEEAEEMERRFKMEYAPAKFVANEPSTPPEW